MIEELPKKSLEEIVTYIKSFDAFEVHTNGTDWNCELCGSWRGRKGNGVDNAIYLYTNGEFEGEMVALGSSCIKKVLDKLGEIK